MKTGFFWDLKFNVNFNVNFNIKIKINPLSPFDRRRSSDIYKLYTNHQI
jgi:hypothetical protein